MEKALEVRNLSLSLNNHKILDNLSFSLEKGSFAVLCGRNGAGKSQLLRCIKGLVNPDCGEILVDGVSLSAKARMKKIAIVFQDADMQIVSQSVEKDVAFGPENMGLDKKEIVQRVEKALSLMGLEDKVKQRPQTLSGGEKRKSSSKRKRTGRQSARLHSQNAPSTGESSMRRAKPSTCPRCIPLTKSAQGRSDKKYTLISLLYVYRDKIMSTIMPR